MGSRFTISRATASRRRPPKITAAQRRAAMPPRLRLLTDVGGAVLAAVVTAYIARYPAALPWPVAAAVGAAGAAVFIAWRLTPRYVYTTAVLALWVAAVPLITWLFAAVTPEFGLDYEGRLAGLALYGLLVAVLAHRTSTGRPWLTVAIALAAVTAIAAISYAAGWTAGVWLAYAAGFVAVALRSTVGSWVQDTLDQIAEWWTMRKHPRVDLARWDTTNTLEVTTADILGRLDDSWRVVHDRTIPGSVDDAEVIDHIAIGPPGITVIASLQLGPGAVQQRPDGSLFHQGRNLDRPLRETWWQARVVHTRIDLPTAAVLALHGGTPLDEPLQVGMYEHTGDGTENLTGAVILVHADADNGQQLLDALTGTAALDPWTPGQVKRYTRRVTRAFPAGQVIDPTSWDQRRAIADLWPQNASPAAVTDAAPPDRPMLPAEAQPGPTTQSAGGSHASSEEAQLALETRESNEPDARLPKHREYAWDGGPDADERAHASLQAIMLNTLRHGDRVNSLRIDGMLIGWVVVSDAYVDAESTIAVIDIADPDDYARAIRDGTEPNFIVEALDSIEPVDR